MTSIQNYYAVVPKLRASKNKEEVRKLLSEEPFNIPEDVLLTEQLKKARQEGNNELVYIITQAMYRLRYL